MFPSAVSLKLLQICLNLHASLLVQPRMVLNRMHIAAQVAYLATESEAGPRLLNTYGWSIAKGTAPWS